MWTLYPHTPDNSFLGFAMQLPQDPPPRSKRKNQSVLYGKSGSNEYTTSLSLSLTFAVFSQALNHENCTCTCTLVILNNECD